MSWSKLSDDFTDDCWTLSDRAFRLHVDGLCWSNRKLYDLRIPKDEIRRFAKHPDAVDELLAAGFWAEDADVYVIRHHAQYQRTRQAVLNQQAANKRNGQKGGRPKREQVRDLKRTHSLTESLGESETERDRTGQAKALEGMALTRPSEALPQTDAEPCFDCGGPISSERVAYGLSDCIDCENRRRKSA